MSKVDRVLAYAYEILEDSRALGASRAIVVDAGPGAASHGPDSGTPQVRRRRPLRQPTLKDVVRGLPERSGFGPRRAVVQCRHGRNWHDVAEVRGRVVLVAVWPHDLRRAPYDVYANPCPRCPASLGYRMLLLPKIREALRVPHRGVMKLDAADVSQWREVGTGNVDL